ncbi:MAG: hypothetical protein IJM83_02710 [Firmicutes bacterium]|nr:hypothetical protein [Bacillota bacterium]
MCSDLNTGGEVYEDYKSPSFIHTCSTHLLTPPSAILEACIPNFVIHEQHINTLFPDLRALTVKHYDCKNGYLSIPDEPGIGNEWSDFMLESADRLVIE